MPFVDNQGTKIYYETHGSGKPLVLVIGLGGSTEAWKLQIKEFSQKYQVIVFDNRGSGKSDKPDEPYSMKIFAADMKALLDELNVSSAYFLGVSMGGMIVQEFFLSYPDYVDAMIIACSGFGIPDPMYVPPKPEIIQTLQEKETPENFYQVTKNKVEIFYHESYCKQVPDLVDRILEMKKQIGMPAYAYQRQLAACYLEQPISPRFAEVSLPKTLILHGDEDLVWPVANAHKLKELWVDAKVEIISQSGHMFFVEKAPEFNQAVNDFLEN